MDLSSMLNDGPAPHKKPSQSAGPSSHHQAGPTSLLTSGPGPNAQQRAGPHALLQHDPPSSAHARGLTPLHTPSLSSQHSFQQHLSQSPVGSGQQHSPYASHPSLTPGARPPSHGYPQQPALHPQANTISPTPPSHHSQTPQSVRQSPSSATSFGNVPQLSGHPIYQHSQPNTPLGPPPPLHHRTSLHGSQTDAQSPFQQRTFSGSSNGLPPVTGSPAQRHGLNSLAGSPSTYHKQSPHTRRTSDYLGSTDRDRSLSVSPKTTLVQRPSSLGSRHSSAQDVLSGHSSRQASVASQLDAQNHMMSQPTNLSMANESSHVTRFPVQKATLGPANSDNARPPLSLNLTHHRSEKMGMNNLITPINEYPPDIGLHQSSASSQSQGVGRKARAKEHSPSFEAQSSVQIAATNGALHPTPSESRKRPAEGAAETARPPKREKMVRQRERPLWAQLSRRNPRYVSDSFRDNGPSRRAPPNPSSQPQHQAQSRPAEAEAALDPSDINVNQPWINAVPVDMDLLHARRVLGPWEKSIKWNTPYPDLLKAVQDWLFAVLNQHQDVGQDESMGTIEVEAKIGRLFSSRDGNRARIPTLNMTAMDPSFNRDYRFESEMEEREFQSMNKFLNDTIQKSLQPGRVPMVYKHIRETDSFANLSAAGFAALPPSVHKAPLHGRELKLRTTHDDKTGQVKARIIKVPLADLHLSNPSPGYDCRISINLEVNLMREGLDFNELTEAPTEKKPLPPSRRKDRLSYKHLAYQIDLTKVDVAGIASKYELELEVDSKVLREQISLITERKQNAFGDVVSGFLDNATFLMRQQTDK